MLIVAFLPICSSLPAQQAQVSIFSRPLNNLNINLLGDGSLISLNYERLFSVKPKFFLTGKLGLGYNEEFEFRVCLFGPCTIKSTQKVINFLTIPHHITGNFGRRSLFFEVGLGGTLFSGNGVINHIVYPIVGLRVQPRRINKLNFRVFGCLPFGSEIGSVGIGLNEVFFFPFGLSLGYCF